MLSIPNKQLVERDQGLPGLEFMLDPEQIQPVLIGLMRDNADQVAPKCSLTYLRYKPKRRCIAVFDLIAGEQTESFVATAMTSESWGKREVVPPTDNSYSLFAEQQIRLERFPQDRQLRAVAKVFDLNKSTKVLHRILCSGRSAEPAFGKFQDVRLVPLAYKPGRRFVAAVHCDGLPRFTLKFYTKRGYSHAASNALLLSNINNINVRLNDRYRVVAFPWIAGQCLATLSQKGLSPGLLAAFEATGRQLAELHHMPVSMHHQPSQSVAMELEISQIRELANDVNYLMPQHSALLGQVADYVCSATSPPSAIIHGDFYAKQVVVGDKQIQFIDFDDCSLGNPYRDLGNFVAKLHWSEVRGHLAAWELEPMIGSFLQGYQQRNHAWDERSFQLQLCAGILRCAPLPFRGGYDNWPSLTLDLLERAVEIARVNGANQTAKSRFPATSVDLVQRAEILLEDCLNPQRILCELITSNTVDLPGAPSAVEARMLRLKHARRCLVEYKIAFSAPSMPAWEKKIGPCQTYAPDTIEVLGKIRFKGLDQLTPALHQQLVLAGFDRGAEVRVPACLGIVPRLNLWLQEKVDARYVTACDLTSNNDHARIARAIARFHQADVKVARQYGVDDEWQLLSSRLKATAASCPQYAELLVRLQRLCTECITIYVKDRLTSLECCLIHRDFYFDQVLIDDEQVTLLDLDLASMGPPGLDVGNYIAHLYEYSFRCALPLPFATERITEFSKAYLQSNASVNSTDIAFWTFMSLCRLACLSTTLPGRAHCTRQLIDECLSYGQAWLTRKNSTELRILG